MSQPKSSSPPNLPHGWQAVRLLNEYLVVDILPAKGCDILSVWESRTGVDVMWQSPWGLQPTQARGNALSSEAWHAQYQGGWQVIAPNAGDPSRIAAVDVGFHGDACLVPWKVLDLGSEFLVAAGKLASLPIRFERRIALDGPILRVIETATNLSSDSLQIMWNHHPAFGRPLIGPGTKIETSARSFQADGLAPGYLPAGWTGSWPIVDSADGCHDLSVIPDAPRSVLGYLSNFEMYRYSIINELIDLAVTVDWDGRRHPYLWLWQELGAQQHWPWYGEAYVTALEPASSIPGHGFENAVEAKSALVDLAPNVTTPFTIDMRLGPAP